MTRTTTSMNHRLEQAMRRTIDLVLEFVSAPQRLQPQPVPVETDRRQHPPRSRGLE